MLDVLADRLLPEGGGAWYDELIGVVVYELSYGWPDEVVERVWGA